jgi:hypothetical protein
MAATGNYLRRMAALRCPIHQAIKDEASRRLAHSGVYSKEEVLEALSFEAIGDAIRWDYVREFIQEDQGCELMPLAQSYFTRHPKAEEHVNPAKFLAQGHGKKTAGYAAVTGANDHLVVARISFRRAQKNGVQTAFDAYVKAVETRRAAYQDELVKPGKKMKPPEPKISAA